MEKAQRAPGWLRTLRGEAVPETEEYGIESFVFRARRPFHPGRLWEFIHGSWKGVLRSKGFFWLATRMEVTGVWAQAGGACSFEPAGLWWDAVPREQWPEEPEARAELEQDMQAPWGDRRQELVFITRQVDQTLLREALEECLLTDEELAPGPPGWSQLEDPLPPWVMVREGEDEPSAEEAA